LDPTVQREQVAMTLERARQHLLAHRTAHGAFESRLSSSALSTATAAIALALAGRDALAARGHAWLAAHPNDDGGFGDTVDSPSNVATTALCLASLALAEDKAPVRRARERAEAWLARATGGGTPEHLARALALRYGEDRTFSAPILLACAVAGRLGDGPGAWQHVPTLPFELCALPHRVLRWLRLPMVSYAIPALIAIGLARHVHVPSRNPLARALRNACTMRTLRVLNRVQPESGGFLEAAPLTSFVLMSLLSVRLPEHPVVARALAFLEATVRDDGAWPIDTNLDTWVTTQAVVALGDALPPNERECVRRWLLGQQYRRVHPYTASPPGGFAWTDLSGGVPDADDTAGALLALRALGGSADVDAAALALRWLCDLQNGDGGVPTFCRGFGTLPFDRSSPDLTAHALRAFAAWCFDLPERRRARVDRAIERGVRYLLGSQRDDGAFVPLWFGNQHEPREENPLYGTSRVLRAIEAVRRPGDAAWQRLGERALAWLCDAQHDDGSFGAGPGVPASIEETALGLDALAGCAHVPGVAAAAERAAAWLCEHTSHGTRFPAAPIGLYFARLWYAEQLYPVVFTVGALSRWVDAL
jgi:squalene-hopene/tetraprenyl-beta-curcumene cyclase